MGQGQVGQGQVGQGQVDDTLSKEKMFDPGTGWFRLETIQTRSRRDGQIDSPVATLFDCPSRLFDCSMSEYFYHTMSIIYIEYLC